MAVEFLADGEAARYPPKYATITCAMTAQRSPTVGVIVSKNILLPTRTAERPAGSFASPPRLWQPAVFDQLFTLVSGQETSPARPRCTEA